MEWDSCESAWLESRGPKLHLIAMVDEGTSRAWAHFADHDSVPANMHLLWNYLEQFGRPVRFCTDKSPLFAGKPQGERKRQDPEGGQSQIKRALGEIGIQWKAVDLGPEAPVTRFFAAAQTALVEGLRHAGVDTLDAANRYLRQVFLPAWNAQLAAGAGVDDTHVPLKKNQRLADVLCHVENRTVGQDRTLLWYGMRYQIPAGFAGSKRCKVDVLARLDDTIAVRYGDQVLDVYPWRQEEADEALKLQAARPPRRARKPRAKAAWMNRFDLNKSLPIAEIYRRGYLTHV